MQTGSDLTAAVRQENRPFVRKPPEDREYGFYDTIDRLEQSLPPLFVRCHRSYLVNSGWIAGVKLSSGCLRLKNDIELPVSRSYKNRFKEKKR